MHVGFADQRIDNQPDIMAVDCPHEMPITGPCVHLNLDEARANAPGEGSSRRVIHTPAGLAYEASIRLGQRSKGDASSEIFRG